MTVDGTDFRIQEQRPFSRGWYSQKFNGPAVKYELAICIKTGDIVAFCGPFRGGEHDLSIFRFRLKDALLPYERVIGDKGYRGDLKVVTPYLYDCESAQHRRAMAVLRARHETINRRFKTYGALHDIWRHDVHKHHIVFKSCGVLSQIIHENGREAFQVTGYSHPAIPSNW